MTDIKNAAPSQAAQDNYPLDNSIEELTRQAVVALNEAQRTLIRLERQAKVKILSANFPVSLWREQPAKVLVYSGIDKLPGSSTFSNHSGRFLQLIKRSDGIEFYQLLEQPEVGSDEP